MEKKRKGKAKEDRWNKKLWKRKGKAKKDRWNKKL